MTATGSLGTLARGLIALAIVAVAGAVAWFLFLEYPVSLTDLLGVVLAIVLVGGVLRLAGRIAESLVPSYNVAEVAVEGPITRDGGGGPSPRSTVGAAADDVVEEMERADADRGADALLVKLNTPGGEIVPSKDIRLAAEAFDGPTVAYATDVCASGGYEIASGCDEIWAREGSLVGSIGVIGSRVTAADLADRLGLDYEQFTAGEYKDAGNPLKEMRPDERAYLQGLVDDHYDDFVDDVVAGRDLDEEAVRETEARVFLGGEAAEVGLVDAIGTREDVIDRLEDDLGEQVRVEEFEPSKPLAQRLRAGTESVAYALGAGLASTVAGDVEGFSLRR